jgi:hypothetical protein
MPLLEESRIAGRQQRSGSAGEKGKIVEDTNVPKALEMCDKVSDEVVIQIRAHQVRASLYDARLFFGDEESWL